MEKQTETIEISPKNMFVSICIVQAVCVAVILIAVIIIKFFFDDGYKKIEKWCQNNLFEQTKITANFDEETSSEI